MADRTEDESSRAAGYGRPPLATQFKPGQSGNPRGRPRKDRSRWAIAARVFGEIRRLSGQPRGARVRFTTLELVVMTLKQLSAAGHARASALYTRFVERYGTRASPPDRRIGFLVVPEELTPEEWMARYSPKDGPPKDSDHVE